MRNNDAFPSTFTQDSIPNWPCPQCGSYLSCQTAEFNAKDKAPINRNHEYFEPDWIEYVFTMHLKCVNPQCECQVVCIGSGNVSQEDIGEDNGNWEWVDRYHVKFFEPPLQIFTPPIDTPHWVKEALTTSFSTFFSSPSVSLSTLRSVLEVLLDEMGIASSDENGKFLSLAKRIGMLPEEHRKIVEPANAIRWLGNDGTHAGGFQVRKSDVIDGYRIFEHILIELYPEKKASIEDLVSRINEKKGIVR